MALEDSYVADNAEKDIIWLLPEASFPFMAIFALC